MTTPLPFEQLLLVARTLGRETSLVSSQPVPLGDPEVVWLITAGEVDLFVVDQEHETTHGTRKHLCSFQAESLLMGLPETNEQSLIAVAHPDTTGIQLRVSELDDLFQNKAHQSTICELFDNWIIGLILGLSDTRVPRKSTRMVAGESKSFEGPTSIFSPTRVLWIELARGNSHYLGDPLPEGTNELLLPLTHQGWVRYADEGEITAQSSLELLLPSLCSSDLLSRFHFTFQEVLSIKLAKWRAGQRTQFDHSVSYNAAEFSASVEELAVLNGSEHVSAVVDFKDEANLVKASRRVCHALGVTLPRVSFSEEELEKIDLLPKVAIAGKLRKREVVLKGRWWNENHGPLLAYWEDNELVKAVALICEAKGGYTLHDPMTSKAMRVTAQVAEQLQPKAIQFYQPFPEGKLSPLTLIKFAIKGNKRDLLAIGAIGMMAGLLGLAMPMATGQIFDRVIPEANISMLWQLAFALLAVAVGQVMFSVAQTLALLRTEFNMNRKVQAAVWDRLLRLPASFYRDYNAGDLALRAQGVDSIRRLLAGVVMSSVLAGIFSFWYFALLFYYSLTLAVVATLLAVVAGAISVWATHYQIRYQRLILEYQGRLASFLLQVFIGINKLKISGTEDRAFREWAKRYSAKRQSELQAGEIKNNFAIFHAAFPTISSIALFWFVGSGQFMAEPGSAMGNPANAAASMLFPKLSVGTFLAFYAAYGAFIGSILGLVNAGLSALSVVPLWERAKPILSAECEVLSDGQMPDELTGQIEVSSLSFRYSEVLPYVLHDINLRIDSGDFVALVGASGSGKSTLFRLLVGLETPSSGGVYYDGMSLTHLDLREVRRQIGVVLQNTKIVGGTILTNIIGSKKLGAGDAWRAAKMAAIAKEIKRMPMGIHTIMMQDGASLSGGQRQRLLIARALVHNPRILFFDEATSALDNRTQALVSTSIERLHVTRIVVAHRLSTIRHADKIVVLDKGRIIEVGNFEELMSLNGIFASLAKRQLA